MSIPVLYVHTGLPLEFRKARNVNLFHKTRLEKKYYYRLICATITRPINVHVSFWLLISFTGDLTDAKTVDMQGSMQYEKEWKEYDRILKSTKITEKTVWLDTRGNHGMLQIILQIIHCKRNIIL